jgi:hypothetical protein
MNEPHFSELALARYPPGLGRVRKGYPGSQRLVMTIVQAARKDSARLS